MFIDGRAEMYSNKVNNTNVLSEYFDVFSGQRYPYELFDKYKFNYFLVFKKRPTGVLLSHDNNYKILFEDKNYFLFKKMIY